MSAPPRKTRVVIAEDHPSVAAALKRLIGTHFDIVAEVADGQAAVDVATRLRPDVMILDLWLPKIDGLEACRRVRRDELEIKLIVMSADVCPELIEESRRLGISAVVSKIEMHDALIAAIDAAVLPTPT